MSSYTSLLYHIVFSTKHRRKVLTKENRKELFQYMWGVMKNKKCFLYRINGVEDHIHILVSLPSTMAVADFVKNIKVSSSIWIRENKIFPDFTGWQNGYGAFTVSEYHKDRLIQYIINQEEHHKNKTFKKKYKSLLERYNIEYDETYLF